MGETRRAACYRGRIGENEERKGKGGEKGGWNGDDGLQVI